VAASRHTCTDLPPYPPDVHGLLPYYLSEFLRTQVVGVHRNQTTEMTMPDDDTVELHSYLHRLVRLTDEAPEYDEDDYLVAALNRWNDRDYPRYLD